MPLDSITAPNEGGVATPGRSSKEGTRFFLYLEKILDVPIQREVRKAGFIVDAFISNIPHKLEFDKLQDIPIGSDVALEYNGNFVIRSF